MSFHLGWSVLTNHGTRIKARLFGNELVRFSGQWYWIFLIQFGPRCLAERRNCKFLLALKMFSEFIVIFCLVIFLLS